MTNKFFMYGTLKEGHRFDHKFLSNRRTSVQKATIKGGIFSLGPYPTVKLGGKNLVIGEVHTFPEKYVGQILQTLDQIEGYNEFDPENGLYNRHKVQAYLEDGDVVVAWVYEYNGEVDPSSRLKEGLWEPGM